MTDEKFNELIRIKEEIARLEGNLKTIDYLFNSTDLNIQITGISNCELKVCRHLKISNQDVVKNALHTEKISIHDRLYKLKKEFERL